MGASVGSASSSEICALVKTRRLGIEHPRSSALGDDRPIAVMLGSVPKTLRRFVDSNVFRDAISGRIGPGFGGTAPVVPKTSSSGTEEHGILGYARVSTGDQDLSGQRRHVEVAGAVRIFEDVISGREFKRPGLAACLTMPARATACAWCAWTASADRCRADRDRRPAEEQRNRHGVAIGEAGYDHERRES